MWRTKSKNWLRARAHHAVDALFCSSSPDIRRVGDLDSGWVMRVQPSPQVCYCAGVGKEMTFERELGKIAGEPVLVFDPSPTGIATFEKSDTFNLRFFPVGLASDTGVVEFSVPSHPSEGSYSVLREGVEKVSFECWNLQKIMRTHGHVAIDLLKMDIEGFEYDIVDGFLEEGIPVRQLCVEFHPWLKPGRTLKTIAKLYKAGYRIIHKQRGDHTFVLKDSHAKRYFEKTVAEY